jgi:hypothetical protein
MRIAAVTIPKATATVQSQPAGAAACPEVLVGGGVGATVGTGVSVGHGHAGTMLPSGSRINAKHWASMLSLLLVGGNSNPATVTMQVGL